MKRFCVLWLALLLILPTACAETQYWTQNADWYYHAAEHCGGANNRVPISRQAAEAFGKAACPVCIADETEYPDKTAVERGGTIVVRISDTYVNGLEMGGAWWGGSLYTGNHQIFSFLARALHGEAYAEVLNTFHAKGEAEGTLRLPVLYARGSETNMGLRHLGGAWYLFLDAGAQVGDSYPVEWCIMEDTYTWSGDTLKTNFAGQTVNNPEVMSVQHAQNPAAASYERDGLSVTIYREMDCNIAVIYHMNAEPNEANERVALYIGGKRAADGMAGFKRGANTLYCTVLTDAECNALEAGEALALEIEYEP